MPLRRFGIDTYGELRYLLPFAFTSAPFSNINEQCPHDHPQMTNRESESSQQTKNIQSSLSSSRVLGTLIMGLIHILDISRAFSSAAGERQFRSASSWLTTGRNLALLSVQYILVRREKKRVTFHVPSQAGGLDHYLHCQVHLDTIGCTGHMNKGDTANETLVLCGKHISEHNE